MFLLLSLDHALHVLFLFFLLLDHLQVCLVITLLDLICLLIVFVVNLGVVLVFAATAAISTLCAAFFEVTFLLGDKATVLTVKCILKLHLASIILSAEVHTHVLALSISVNIIVLGAVRIILSESEVLVIVFVASYGRHRPGVGHAGVGLQFPPGGEVHHGLALAVTELGEQLVELVVKEQQFVVLDLLEQLANLDTAFSHLLFVKLLVEIV